MPRSNRLKVIAAGKEEALETLIPRLLAEYRTPYKVAVALGVYPNTINWYLQQNGYYLTNTGWEKKIG